MEDREKKIREYWDELKPFTEEVDVPHLPHMNHYFMTRLIQLGALPKILLEDGVWYYGNYRNSNLGKWSVLDQKFNLWRWKFGWRTDDCNHFEDDDGFALFVPLRKATEEEVNAENNNTGKDPKQKNV